MLGELIKIANELDRRKLTVEADALDMIIKKSMAAASKDDRKKFKHYVTDADKQLTMSGESKVSSRDIANYYVENPISLEDPYTGEHSLVNLYDFYNSIRDKHGHGPVSERAFLQTVSKAREWGDNTMLLKNLWRQKKKKAVKSLMKTIEQSRGASNHTDASWIKEVAERTGLSAQTIYGYSMAHTIDTPFGQLMALLKRRHPKVLHKNMRPFVSEALKNLSSMAESMTPEEQNAFPALKGVVSINDLNLKSKAKDENGFIIPNGKEILYTLSLLNDASGSRSSLQAASLDRILKDIVLEELMGSIYAGSAHLAQQGCGETYVPNMPKETFSSLYKSPYVTDDLISIKISQYIEECFDLKKSPKTIWTWFSKMGLWKKRKSAKSTRDSVPKSCENLQPLLNRLICTEISCMPKTSIGEVKEHGKRVYTIMKNFLKERGISIASCISSKEIYNIKSCSWNSQNKYESLKKYIDTDKEMLYSLISKEIDGASRGQAFGSEIVESIKEYFQQNSACVPDPQKQEAITPSSWFSSGYEDEDGPDDHDDEYETFSYE